MTTVNLSTKYQVVIPKEIRERSGLDINSRLEISIVPNSDYILLKPAKKNLTQYYKGLAKKTYSRINLDRYIEESRNSWEK